MVAGAILTTILIFAATGHPIHSSLTTIRIEPGSSVVAVRVKVYAEDFPPGSDLGRIAGYLSTHLRLLDASGNPIPLELVGQQTEGTIQLIDASARLGASARITRIENRLLMDRFADQVNVVQVEANGKSTTLLLVPSDPSRPLTLH